MRKKSTDLKSAKLHRIIRGNPSLALFISASLIGSARADQHGLPPAGPLSSDAVSVGARIQNRLLQTSKNLILPTNILDAHDSLLLRELLLTQGVELDLGARAGINKTLMQEFLTELKNDELLNSALDIELLLDSKADSTMSLHSSIIFPPESADRTDRKNGVIKDWQLLWLDPVVNGQTSSDVYEKASETESELREGVSSRWNVDLVLTRPATPEEIILLEEKAGVAAAAGAPLPGANVTDGASISAHASTDTEVIATESAPLSSNTPVPKPASPSGGSPPDATGPGVGVPSVPIAAAPPVPGAGVPSSTAIGPPVGLVPDLDSGESRSETEAPPDVVTDGIFSISDEVPEGFESLAGSQFLVVDVKYNGEPIGSVAITVTGEELTIDEPAALVALMPNVLEPEELVEAFSYPLPTNANKICYGPDDPPGCGQLDVELVGVIYDESNLLLDVFVNSNYQQVVSPLSTRYLPQPESKNTSILSVYGTASDLPGEEQNVDLSARGLFGYGDGNVATEVDYNTRSDRQRLNQLKLTHHFPDHELVAGSYSYQTGGALPDINLLGVGFASSLKTRVDLEHAFSTELVVYLARRSVVQLVVDDKIYYGESYPAGNQAIDTRLLPDGTYDVELRILDSQSGSRVETRRFTKSTQLPPRGETMFQITAGTPLLINENFIFPETAGVGVAGFSFARRLSDQSSYRLGLLQFGSNSFLQAGYIYLGEFVSFQFGGSAGGDNTRAASARLSWLKDNLSVGMSAEQFSSEADVTENRAYEQFYTDDFRQLTFSINRAFKTFSLGGRWNYRETDNEATGNTTTLGQYALYYRRPLFRSRSLRGLLDASVLQDDTDRRFSLQVKFFIDRGQWSTGLGAAIEQGDNQGRGYQVGIDTRWQNSDRERYQWEAGFYADTSKLGDTAGASLTLDHPWYQAGLSSDVNLDATTSENTSSVAFFNAHIGADRHGVALGGSDFAQAGVIVDVQGQPKGARFDIIVNNIKASTGSIGERQFIGLQPFENYEVRFRPHTVLSNGVDKESFKFTLYPGGVQRIEILAQQKVLLIATLVNQFGETVENALIDYGANPILIEEGGFFQGEVVPGETVLVKPSVGPECEFVVPDADGEEVLVLDEPLLCSVVQTD